LGDGVPIDFSMRSVSQDTRYAARLLYKSPGFTAASLITMALGIGATVAMFSVADALLWRPLRLPEPERLVMVLERRAEQQKGFIPASPGNFFDWRARATSFEHLAAYRYTSANVAGDLRYRSEPERVNALRVTSNFFDTLGIRPVIGRAFTEAEETPGNDRAAILTHRFWQRRFDGAREIVGSSIEIDGAAVTVIGVMPPDSEFLGATDIWLPLAMSPAERQARPATLLFGVGRLKPGVEVAAAAAEMNSLAEQLEQENPKTNTGWRTVVMSLPQFIIGDLGRQYLLLLLGVAGFVLLIACVNTANLQFARAASRLREMAIRSALGAARSRIIRQLLTESVIVSLLGACAGVFAAIWATDAIRALLPAQVAADVPSWNSIGIDLRAVIFATTVAVLAGVLSGVLPAFASTRARTEALKESRSTGSAARHRIRNVLVCAEVALAMVLLVGASLMARGFQGLLDKERPYRPDTVLTMRVDLPRAKYGRPQRYAEFYGEVLSRVKAQPGVEAASVASSMPHSELAAAIRYFEREEKAANPAREQTLCQYQVVSPEFFTAMRVDLHSGRLLDERDGPESLRTVVISESMARRFWAGEDPLGRRLRIGNAQLTIVGVAKDVVHGSLDRQPRAIAYVPFAQAPGPNMHLVIRTAGDPKRLVAPVRSIVQSLDPQQPVYQVQTYEELILEDLSALRVIGGLIVALGILAAVLAGVGIYAVVSQVVADRTREIGIRVALGAKSATVVREMLARNATAILAGLTIGCLAAIGLARLLAGLLYGVSAGDTASFAVPAAALAIVAMVAAIVPARRASMVDASVALRDE
jgi:putative ABC transport system permease protein